MEQVHVDVKNLNVIKVANILLQHNQLTQLNIQLAVHAIAQLVTLTVVTAQDATVDVIAVQNAVAANLSIQ